MGEYTIKQIADELKVDKQKVYRYIVRNHITEAHQKNGVKYFYDAAKQQIKQAFFENAVLHEVTQNNDVKHFNETVQNELVAVLKQQINDKDKQIVSLQKNISELHQLLDQEQKLHMYEHQKVLKLENMNDSIADMINDLKEENTCLNDILQYHKKRWWKK